jgi:hypothetical protein
MGNKARVHVKPFAIIEIFMVIKLNNLGLGRQPLELGCSDPATRSAEDKILPFRGFLNHITQQRS